MVLLKSMDIGEQHDSVCAAEIELSLPRYICLRARTGRLGLSPMLKDRHKKAQACCLGFDSNSRTIELSVFIEPIDRPLQGLILHTRSPEQDHVPSIGLTHFSSIPEASG